MTAKQLKYPLLGLAVVLLAACGSSSNTRAMQQGRVNVGNPISGATVKLYQAGKAFETSAKMLGSSTTGENGEFSIPYVLPTNDNVVLYLTAEGGRVLNQKEKNTHIKLSTVLGNKRVPKVTINERTTVATAYTMAQFLNAGSIAGPTPGVPNAADIFRNLVSLETGNIGEVLATKPNGSYTDTLNAFNSLANMLAVCVHDQSQCQKLFALATAPVNAGDVPVPPTNTLQAVLNIAHYPYQNPTALFDYSTKSKVYLPALTKAPDAMTLALRYDGNGKEMDGPGFIAFDKEGSAWIANNYTWKEGTDDPDGVVCGALDVLRLTPTGEDVKGLPSSPYTGGGANGAGFGILIDKNDNVWNGNFGFAGTNCLDIPEVLTLSRSVSLYDSKGNALSPDNQPGIPGGYSGKGTIFGPQGMSSDPDNGNIWISNCRNNNQVGDTVTLLIEGQQDKIRSFTPFDPLTAKQQDPAFLPKPFGMTVDIYGNAWVAGNNINQVAGIDADGKRIAIFGNEKIYDNNDQGKLERPIFRPMGIASDSTGGIWVANSGAVDITCYDTVNTNTDTNRSTYISMIAAGILDKHGNDVDNFKGRFSSIALIKKEKGTDKYVLKKFQSADAGVVLPWGIAVDGNDNIWVANFDGQRLSHLCGSNIANCPAGKQEVGKAISPKTGYSFAGLVRNTGVSIDPSGNVWLTNNWLTTPVQTNPGGREVVVFLGLAKPVKTPLLGFPRVAKP